MFRLPRVARQAPACDEDRRDHFLDGRLAVAAGDADERDRDVSAPLVRGLLQRLLRVRHDDLRDARRLLRIDDRASSAGLHRSLDERVAVEVRAVQRDEQLARAERARVGGHAGVRAVGSDELAAAGLRDCRRRWSVRFMPALQEILG